jgi:flagellar motility protein MotE (MotC chaperone)
MVEAMIDTLRMPTKPLFRALRLALASGLLVVALMPRTADAVVADSQASAPAAAVPPAPGPAPSAPRPAALVAPVGSETPTLPEVRKYCTNIASAATEARYAWQTTKLNELETRLKAKIKELDDKEAEIRDWIQKREAIEKKATEKLVDIYSKMRPETAATQLSALDDDMAAAVLGQLGPRQASAIFNEIVPERAAKLAGILAGTNPNADKKL